MEKIRVLYAEGHDLVLYKAKELLEAEGWEVEVCRDSAGALKKLADDGDFDLLILDDRLDRAGGAELLRQARGGGRPRPIPVVLFTAEHAEGVEASARADASVSKPGGLKELVPTCRRLLGRAPAPRSPEPSAAEFGGAAE